MARRKTHEEFVAEVYELVGDKFTVLGKYENSKTKVEIKHNICGKTNFVKPSLFLIKQPCPTCNGGVKKTHDDFVKEVFELEGNNYEVIGRYVRSGDKVKMRHNKCGHEWNIKPNNFTVQNNRCPECYKKIRGQKRLKKNDVFLKEVYDLVGEEYSVLSEYKGANKKVTMKHNKCNYVYDVIPPNFLSGKRCPQCSGCIKRTQEKFEAEVFEMYENEYTVLGQYKNNRESVEVIHNICGYIWKVVPLPFLKGHGCPQCAGNIQKTHEEFVKEVYELVGNEYTVLGKYINCKTKIEIKHNECNHIWGITSSDFLARKRCPRCNASKGETAISKWLDKNKVKYDIQYRIDECRNKEPLPFDVAVYLNDGSFMLIEFQGIQHYEVIEYFDGLRGYIYRKKNDWTKKYYCIENDIPLLEIPYWELENIDDILNEHLLPLDLMKQKK